MYVTIRKKAESRIRHNFSTEEYMKTLSTFWMTRIQLV